MLLPVSRGGASFRCRRAVSMFRPLCARRAEGLCSSGQADEVLPDPADALHSFRRFISFCVLDSDYARLESGGFKQFPGGRRVCRLGSGFLLHEQSRLCRDCFESGGESGYILLWHVGRKAAYDCSLFSCSSFFSRIMSSRVAGCSSAPSVRSPVLSVCPAEGCRARLRVHPASLSGSLSQ